MNPTMANFRTTPLARLRLLVVDDEPMLRSVIQDFLSLLGFHQQFTAGNGRQALEVLETQPIDCILSDIRMPEMALEELLGVIRVRWPATTVIATSGYSDLESAAHIMERGADDFLGKPLNLDGLETALKWIGWRRDLLDWLAAEAPTGSQFRPGLADALAGAPVFQERMSHCLRVMELLDLLQTDLEPELKEDALSAALLHEMGLGQLIHGLCCQPRKLDGFEQQLVRGAAGTGSRLVLQSLDRPRVGELISRHLRWQDLLPPQLESDPLARAALWLGLANLVDGCTRARPDRPPITPHRLRESLERRRAMHPVEPLDGLLDQWNLIEGRLST